MTKFKNNCIGDNTPENVRVLEELGYKMDKKRYDATEPILNAHTIGSFTSCGEVAYNILKDFSKKCGGIDCRNNPELFKEKVSERTER